MSSHVQMNTHDVTLLVILEHGRFLNFKAKILVNVVAKPNTSLLHVLKIVLSQ